MMTFLMRLSDQVAVAPDAIESAYADYDDDVHVVMKSGQVWRVNPDYFGGATEDVLAEFLRQVDEALIRAAQFRHAPTVSS